MTPSELWLPIGAAAFYLYDSAVLLWQNELVFRRAHAGWRVSGGTELRLGARRLYLPNPLTPMQVLLRVCWRGEEAKAAEAPEARAAADEPSPALRHIGFVNQLQLLLLLALAPALWFAPTAGPALLVFLLFYLATFAALAITWRQRASLQLSRRDFWLLAFDGLACAPFAINLTRKLARRHRLASDPLRFAARRFSDAELARTRQLVEARVREEYADPDAVPRGEALLASLLPRLAR